MEDEGAMKMNVNKKGKTRRMVKKKKKMKERKEESKMK